VTVITLDELGPGTELPVTPEQGRLLARSAVVTAVPAPYRAGYWRISPAGQVGAARVGGLEIHVRPKLAISRLLFIAGYARHGAAWQQQVVHVPEAAGLTAIMAQLLWRRTAEAVHHGLLPGYVTVEESSPVLRGRLREAEQLRRHHGLPFPLEIRHDEFTVDIPENRILRTALERMLAVPGVDPQSQRSLRRLLRDFADVAPLARREPCPPWSATSRNVRYHDALRLAELILRASSADAGAGGVAVNGFLLDMPRLFEDFVTTGLREMLVAIAGGRVESQVASHFDAAGRVTVRPDIVWRRQGSVRAVIDAKYKAEKPAGYPNADLYQLLAYCTVLGLATGHLVYAEGSGQPVRHAVRRSGVEIVCHAVDLDDQPDALLARLRELGQRVAGPLA
jgi:5-methylcytosine-specific restriction enzyme subunit McrC